LQFVSVITFAEIQKGIGVLAEGKRRNHLQQWLMTELGEWFSGRIFPIDRSVANQWAELLVYCSGKGRPLPSIDPLLAVTALEHGLTLVTRNVKDFEGIGLTVLNPWTD
jgi:predicted nucleic acid-binding protein